VQEKERPRNTPQSQVRVTIATPHPVISYGLSAEFRRFPAISVTGKANTFFSLFRLLQRKRCDVLVIDFDLHYGLSPTSILNILSRRARGPRSVVLTNHIDMRGADHLSAHGVLGIVDKSDESAHVGIAVLHAIENQAYQGPTVQAMLA
jgi:two-component system, NarL family, captular synthesis response regulator RcsB